METGIAIMVPAVESLTIVPPKPLPSWTGGYDVCNRQICDGDTVEYEGAKGAVRGKVKYVDALAAFYLIYEDGSSDLLHAVGYGGLEVI